MPQNLELKVRVRSLRQIAHTARRIGARKVWTRSQRDTYYVVRRGRLKLRETLGQRAELIAYLRPNTKGSRSSLYTIFPVERPRSLDTVLAGALGTRVIVQKQRTLYQYRNCRIHADRVRSLGNFLEFEVLVTRGTRQARRLLESLRKEFAVSPQDVVGASYSDLLIRQRKRKRQ